VNRNDETYKLIKIFAFDSERKCMSVLVKHPSEQNRAILFVKGADSSVLTKLASNQSEVREQVEANVEMFASKGLRTLCFAMKELNWDEKQDPAFLKASDLENELTLLGATGLEDLL
jgi:magnesium-transporting ATPase (P-type)